jgi:hypothetical protein
MYVRMHGAWIFVMESLFLLLALLFLQVYGSALPLGGAHELGTEDGSAGAGRQPSGAEAPAAGGGSSEMLDVNQYWW